MLDRSPASGPRALVLTPTRELAAQVGDRFAAYGRFTMLKTVVIYGGVNERPQIQALKRGVDIVIATPGRLIDLLNRQHVSLACIQTCILDEADRMLDMGFIRDIRKIMKALPSKRQSLLFSATMPGSIESLAQSFLSKPVRVHIAPKQTTSASVEQTLIHVEPEDKRKILSELLQVPEMKRAIVFTRTKHRANRLAKQLDAAQLRTAAIHGNKSQGARLRALDAFKRGQVNVLVATDVAARGIDIDGISHVFNYELPREAESYVHRIGRTGRAGQTGVAISLCSTEESKHLRAIERLIGFAISSHGAPRNEALEPSSSPPPHRKQSSRRRPRARRSASQRIG